ncbi:MAG: hypothetical protein C4538_12105 [Nitrospiraceae bacterium]|nr:MAG: hypothetical protein C4538_12105 [Nitrospiraceae bacterium]
MRRLGPIAILFACLSLLSVSGTVAFADSKTEELIKKHIEKVKQKNPKKYEAMVQAAGGNIIDCLSCHADIFKETTRYKKNQPK